MNLLVDAVEGKYHQSNDQPIVLSKELLKHHVTEEDNEGIIEQNLSKKKNSHITGMMRMIIFLVI